MKYPLDFESTFEKSLLFWLTRFIRNKTTSLSNSNITDQNKMAILIKSLINDIRSIDDLTKTAKELRKIGMNGLNVYYTPLEKLPQPIYSDTQPEVFGHFESRNFLSVKL